MKEQREKRDRMVNMDSLDFQTKEIFREVIDEFENTSIFKLREMARRMGIKSTTTMDKHSLVTIMSELRVASTVYYPPEKVKVSPVTYSEVEELNNDYMCRTLVLKPEKVFGILDISPTGAWLRTDGFAPAAEDIFVPMLMVNELMLRPGDEVAGLARFMERCGRFGLFKAEKVNSQTLKEFERSKLSDPVPATQIVALGKGSRTLNAVINSAPLCKGQRRLVVGVDGYKMDELARELVTKMSEAGFETVGIFLDESPENIPQIMALPGRTVALDCDGSAVVDSAARLATDYAKNIAAYGRHVALLVSNAEVLSEQTLRYVFAAGMFTQNGSITVTLMSSSLELNPVINRLSHSATAINLLKGNYTDEPLIDLRRSFADSEKLLTSIEMQTLRDLRKQLSGQYVSVKEFNAAYEILLADNQPITQR